ncbi:hypothetical protein MCG98_08675 [Ruminococcus sp. OA3]|uniref:hypothetical protein n=1 Tax=Ruminococcus sp. OA3 TaxID=2914164 RepID=UPI001F06AED9|nr:hypothetical protein [Ruminococcus sp. OA3]MCH1982634.1 hypothetical protein [Ruminococcus sp. OA3]
MMLSDVREDYIASQELADHVDMGKLPDKQERSVGVLYYEMVIEPAVVYEKEKGE